MTILELEANRSGLKTKFYAETLSEKSRFYAVSLDLI